MQQATLSNEEKRIVKRYGEEFKKWLDSETGKKEMQDLKRHIQRYYILSFISTLKINNIFRR